MSDPCGLAGVERDARRWRTKDWGVQGTASRGSMRDVRGQLLSEKGLLELRLRFPL